MRTSANTIFSFLLTVIVALMIFLSLGYNEKSRFFPLLFGIATFALLIFQLLSDSFERIEKKLTFVRQESVFAKFIEPAESQDKLQTDDKEEMLPLAKVFRLFIWLISLTCALRFINYVATASVFIFLLIAVEAKAGWFRALIVAACVGLFIFVLFGAILKVNFQV